MGPAAAAEAHGVMRVLVTNDDGIEAPGLRALVRALARIAEVVVVAPVDEQSATGHRITITHPLRVLSRSLDGAEQAFAVTGTPADCVKIGVDLMRGRPPDLVVAGINAGANTGVNLWYSGTVAGAREARLLGYPAMAVSLALGTAPPDYGPAARIATALASFLVRETSMDRPLLNINVPGVPLAEMAGLRVVANSCTRLVDTLMHRRDPRGDPYYWLAFEAIERDMNPETDDNRLRDKYVTVTPLASDQTSYRQLEALRRRVSETPLVQEFGG